MNICLICNSGMSTFVLVRKMRESAVIRKLEVNIEAYSADAVDKIKGQADVILVGPQIRHMFSEIEKTVSGACPVGIISMRDFGMINGENVLDQSLLLINK